MSAAVLHCSGDTASERRLVLHLPPAARLNSDLSRPLSLLSTRPNFRSEITPPKGMHRIERAKLLLAKPQICITEVGTVSTSTLYTPPTGVCAGESDGLGDTATWVRR